jgi:hypothetical protein
MEKKGIEQPRSSSNVFGLIGRDVSGSVCWNHGKILFQSHIDNAILYTTPSFSSPATLDEISKPFSTRPKFLASNAQFTQDLDFYN